MYILRMGCEILPAMAFLASPQGCVEKIQVGDALGQKAVSARNKGAGL